MGSRIGYYDVRKGSKGGGQLGATSAADTEPGKTTVGGAAAAVDEQALGATESMI